MLTSRRPESLKVFTNGDGPHRQRGGNFTTLPQHLKQLGYRSIGMGKSFHQEESDAPFSWSEPYYIAPNKDDWRLDVSWLIVNESDLTEPLPDMYVTQEAVRRIEELAPAAVTRDQPFFMTVGLQKPHLSMYAPSRFFDMYPPENIQLPVNDFAPVNQPEISWNNCPEKNRYNDLTSFDWAFNQTLPDDYVLDLRRAYYSCVTYMSGSGSVRSLSFTINQDTSSRQSSLFGAM